MMTIEYDEVPQDGEGAKAALVKIAAMVDQQRKAEQALAEAEAAAKLAKARLFKIESEDLPELIRESGLSQVTLEDGTSVKVVDEIACGISAERKPEAYDWLRSHGAGGLIKVLVGVSFGKGEEQKAAKLLSKLITTYGADQAFDKEDVHYQTLKSYLKERIAAAAEYEGPKEKAPIVPPFDLFGVQPFAMAKITAPKVKKGKVS
jgi:hypothetical protein